MSILTFALQMFNIDGHSPGLLRAVDGAGNILDLQTWFTNITWPRRLYLQLSSFTEFQKVVTLCAPMRHSPPLSWEEQQEQERRPLSNLCALHFSISYTGTARSSDPHSEQQNFSLRNAHSPAATCSSH